MPAFGIEYHSINIPQTSILSLQITGKRLSYTGYLSEARRVARVNQQAILSPF
jgi:hypothetical protein